MASIHEKIKFHRERLGLSMTQFAQDVGVRWQTVQQWEKNTAPKRTRLAKVAKALGVTTSELMSDDNTTTTYAKETPSIQSLGDLTYEELLAALVAKLISAGHPEDIEAAPTDLKRAIGKALRPNARVEIEPQSQTFDEKPSRSVQSR